MDFEEIIIHCVDREPGVTMPKKYWSPSSVDNLVNKSVGGENHAYMTYLFIKVPAF